MAGAGPFEPRPLLAVALSGGPDSLGLLCLARRWCVPRQGRLIALIVDHGLRAESAQEAARVAGWMRAQAIECAVLRWRREDAEPADRPAPRPRGLQAAARDARYRLLVDYCRAQGIAHLLLGHHRDDQAETVAMRRERGGGEGLSGMALSRDQGGVRLLRPALGLRRQDLAVWARRGGFEPVEDPSNRDRRFERVRWRARLAGTPALSRSLAGRAEEVGRQRAQQEAQCAADLAACVSLHPAGFARIHRDGLLRLPDRQQVAVLRALLACIGAAAYAADREKVRKLRDRAIVNGRAGTLAGVRLLPGREDLLVVRERRRLPAPQIVVAGPEVLVWDRFHLVVPNLPAGPPVRLAALGQQVAPAGFAPGRWQALPAAARESLPALRQADRVLWAAYLGPESGDAPRVRWQPGRPLAAIHRWT